MIGQLPDRASAFSTLPLHPYLGCDAMVERVRALREAMAKRYAWTCRPSKAVPCIARLLSKEPIALDDLAREADELFGNEGPPAWRMKHPEVAYAVEHLHEWQAAMSEPDPRDALPF